MSSRIDKYRRIMEKKEKAGKPCDILYIVKLDDSRESVFLIQDMFPITEEYIEREYIIAGNHLMLTSEHTVREIEQKARKVMGMLKRGIKFTPTQPDVMEILEKLREQIAFPHWCNDKQNEIYDTSRVYSACLIPTVSLHYRKRHH